jgi:tRNA-splicing ligase RtcB
MQAKKSFVIDKLRKELNERGVIIKADSSKGLLEEAPLAYKDIDEVIGVVKNTGLANPVARLKPLAVIKGD